jgi:opacity protein-like surface antigen
MNQKCTRWMSRAGAAGLLLALSLQAGDKNWYARVDVGGTLINNSDVKDFVVPTAGKMEFDAGFGFGIAGGYHVTPWLGVELQTGYTLNGVRSINTGTGSQSLDATVMQVPLMANVVYECNHCGKFVPFIGAGVGGMTSLFGIDDDTVYVNGSWTTIDGAGADVVFAYQFFGGFRYEFNDRMSLGFLYRFTGSSGPSWDVEDYWGYDMGQIQLDNLYTQSFALLFSVKF